MSDETAAEARVQAEIDDRDGEGTAGAKHTPDPDHEGIVDQQGAVLKEMDDEGVGGAETRGDGRPQSDAGGDSDPSERPDPSET